MSRGRERRLRPVRRGAAGLPPPPLAAAGGVPACAAAPPPSPAALPAAVNAWWIVDLIILPKRPLLAISCILFKVCQLGTTIGGCLDAAAAARRASAALGLSNRNHSVNISRSTRSCCSPPPTTQCYCCRLR